MAVYKKLLLSAGGGIISARQQAEQVENTATILIGLGGTGIDCLRTIKTQVYARLKADVPNAVLPRYEHIRFLGVDTDEKSRGAAGSDENLKPDSVMSLDDTEFFSIGNPDVKKALTNSLALEQRTELSWLRWKDIPVPNLSGHGAGGIRQIGRFMMMDKSVSFRNRVEQEINAAKKGLNEPSVHIHIFAGLSGGTGSGSFLDVCYMIKDIASRVEGVNTYGYFFLPDVNLSKIPYCDNLTRQYIPQNGYAAMQELDYCMQLQFNGGSFVQEYRGNQRIEWNSQPIDMCHLICATDQKGNVIPNAYNYAMNVGAEYIMNFLTKPDDADVFGLDSQLSNFVNKTAVGNRRKQNGFNLSYCIIGASCAVVPIREINTYLTSELFDKFSQIADVNRIPSQSDVQRLAIDSIAKDAKSLDEIYETLLNMILDNAGTEYDVYEDDWKFVRDYGNSDFELHYTNQTAAKMGQIETNAKGMVDLGNRSSLMGRVNTQLFKVMTDLDRGALFAQRLLSASEKNNFLNIIDGLIEQNNIRNIDEQAQEKKRVGDFEGMKNSFEEKCGRQFFNNASKEFDEYDNCRMLLEQHRILLYVYEKLDDVLLIFRKQVLEAESSYYAKFARVMDTLVQTFRENRNTLMSNTMLKTEDSFEEPMMTIEELRTSLDERIMKINVPGMLEAFVRMMAENRDEWILEDENKITRMVTDFFVEKAFDDFADKTITSFLEDKYNIHNNNDLLTKQIYEEWIKPLTVKATPLFYLNNSIWKSDMVGQLASLSVPTTSSPIQKAAQRMYQENAMWEVNNSALTDRIYVMCSACALPLASYNYCESYEKEYFASTTPGCHYYEGRSIKDINFDDWTELPSITPQSLIELDKVPEKMRKITIQGQKLYEEADKYKIFDDKNRICQPDEEQLASCQNIIIECKKFAEEFLTPEQVEKADKLLNELKEAKDISMIPTTYKMSEEGYAKDVEIKKRIQKDYFVSSPAYYGIVEDILSKLRNPMQEAEKVERSLKEQITKIRDGGKEMQGYFDALFTGVIIHDVRSVLYKNDNTFEEIVLSKRGGEFPFYAIPSYQGYVSYGKLSKDIKNEIKEAADKCFDDESKLKTASDNLKEIFTEERFEGWESFASDYEQKKEILVFLRKMKNGFINHCKTL